MFSGFDESGVICCPLVATLSLSLSSPGHCKLEKGMRVTESFPWWKPGEAETEKNLI